jgi:uncharacterized membrane protein YvbJ
MLKLKNNYKRPLRRKISSTGDLTSNPMRRETIIPLAIGLLIGALFVIFFQFNSRLNNNAAVISQLEQATASNTKNVADVINFINSASKGAAGAAGTETPATTPAQ